MMPANRFSFPEGDDSRLIGACDCLKLAMYKDDAGKVTTYFELHGHVGPDDEEDDGDTVFAQNDMALVRDLLAKFERVKD